MTVIAGVEIIHPNKILFPESGITKLDLARYYEKVSEKILTYLKNRPVSLVRAPEGITEQKFYQKHPSENFPQYIERVKIKEKEGYGVYITIDNLNDIIFLVNLGVIEFHVWGSTLPNLDVPDTLVIDLDPAPDCPWEYVPRLAMVIKERFEGDGYKPLVKTSGVKGYHVIITNDKLTINDWDKAKEYTKRIAEEIVEKFPEMATLEMHKENRKGKVFIDYLRNSRGATNVCAFSARTHNGGTVSMPISWEQVQEGIKPDYYKISTL